MPSLLGDGYLPSFDADEAGRFSDCFFLLSFFTAGSSVVEGSVSAFAGIEWARLAEFCTAKATLSLRVADDFLESIKDGSSSTKSLFSLKSSELVKSKFVLGLSSHVCASIGSLLLGFFSGLSAVLILSASRFSPFSFLTLMTSIFN